MAGRITTVDDYLQVQAKMQEIYRDKVRDSAQLIFARNTAAAERDRCRRALNVDLISDGEYIFHALMRGLFSQTTLFYLIGLAVATVPVILAPSNPAFPPEARLVLWAIAALTLRVFYLYIRLNTTGELENYGRFRDYMQRKGEEVRADWKQLCEKVEQLNAKINDRSQCIIPADYQHVAGILWRYIEDGQADTIKEAINLYNMEIMSKTLERIREENRRLGEQLSELNDEVSGLQSSVEFNNIMHLLGLF